MTDQTESWDGFTGQNFLKTENVIDINDAFVVEKVDVFQDEDGKSRPRLYLGHDEDEYIFDLNVTNSNFCKNNGIASPKDLFGKKIYFKKVLVNSPKTKKEVESLRISKIG